MSAFAAELEETNQKTETRCTNIRKEVSKALSEQRQQLISQSEAMAKKMDTVAAKASAHLVACLCLHLCICLCICLSACVPACLLVCLPVLPSSCTEPFAL